MAWSKTREERQRDARVYGDPVYKRNRAEALRRAGGRCELCSCTWRRLQVDHITPVAHGGDHDLGNLQVLCSGPGSCHSAKTATEGGGYRQPADPECTPRTKW